MGIAHLLNRRVDVIDVGESIVAGRVAEARVTVAAGVAVRIVPRRPREILYGESSVVVADHDVYADRDVLALGHELDAGDGEVYVVSGVPRTIRGRGAEPHHYSAPARRVIA